jgi:hypothetical protein
MNNTNHTTSDTSWPNKFLNAGIEMGLGDLSMMIGTVSEILASQEEATRLKPCMRFVGKLHHSSGVFTLTREPHRVL